MSAALSFAQPPCQCIFWLHEDVKESYGDRHSVGLSWVHKFGKMFDTWDKGVFWYATVTDELKLQPAKQAQQIHEEE